MDDLKIIDTVEHHRGRAVHASKHAKGAASPAIGAIHQEIAKLHAAAADALAQPAPGEANDGHQ